MFYYNNRVQNEKKSILDDPFPDPLKRKPPLPDPTPIPEEFRLIFQVR